MSLVYEAFKDIIDRLLSTNPKCDGKRTVFLGNEPYFRYRIDRDSSLIYYLIKYLGFPVSKVDKAVLIPCKDLDKLVKTLNGLKAESHGENNQASGQGNEVSATV